MKILFFLVVSFLFNSLHAENDPAAAIFTNNCSACHLARGQGNKAMNAPAIAGLPTWYVSGQLRKFLYGERGRHKDDITGKLMRTSTTRLNLRSIAFLGRYVQNLEAEDKQSTFSGNIVRGEKLYQQNCSRCHLKNAAGDKTKKIPPLNIQLDWYMLSALEKFDKKQRVHAKVPVVLDYAKDAKDIVAYLTTLKTGKVVKKK